MESSSSIGRRTLRLPQDALAAVRRWASENLTSENAEIVRSIRERMQTTAEASFAGATPAVVPNTAACQGGNEITQG